MPILEQGNFANLHHENNGWILGHMAPGPRQTEAVGVKWSPHRAGWTSPWSTCKKAMTLSVLISGWFRIYFRESKDAPETFIDLKKPGDFILFEGIEHRNESFIDNTVFLTIRLPSLEGDCGPIK